MMLTGFLLARIDQDILAVAGLSSGSGDPEFFWGPDRIRAESAAKLRIVREHEARAWPEDGQPDEICERCGQSWPCHTVAAIAAVYADHPDYREEWRP